MKELEYSGLLMKIGKKSHNSLLTKYSLQYEKNPRSRVFAPLSEAYRKLGMYDEALKVLKKGIKFHPGYTLGYIVLANCYYDQEQYEFAYNTLLPFVSANQENIRLQKIFAQTCEKLGNFEESLNAYKILLLINPNDLETAKKIKDLEDDIYLPNKEPHHQHQDKEANLFDSDEDEWVQVDFNQAEYKFNKEESYDQWNVVKQDSNLSKLDKFKEDIQEQRLEVKEHTLEDSFFYEVYDNHSEDTIDPVTDKMTDEYDQKPIITHTLVDLYCEQGHYDKALSILESILELHPDDKATSLKKEEVELLQSGNVAFLDKSLFFDVQSSMESDFSEISEVEIDYIGHDEQSQLLEHEEETNLTKEDELKQMLQLFLEEIKLAARLKNETSQNNNY